MNIQLTSIATVTNTRHTVTDDNWGPIISEITLTDAMPENAFENIELFSHLEIIYHFDKVNNDTVVYAGRPRENPAYPVMGIFAQRKKDRPNRIGLCTVKLLQHNGRMIKVQGLDAINGTPVLDIKPVFREFEVKEDIHQPGWVSDLMKQYW
jgi:tRNA-Thr(GGU) m(6)t(6)A37 methyltransferase TsaA